MSSACDLRRLTTEQQADLAIELALLSQAKGGINPGRTYGVFGRWVSGQEIVDFCSV